MKLILTNQANRNIPMNKMQPGQFAWCESEKAIIFATWKAATLSKETNFVALNSEGLTFEKDSNIPVQLLPPGTQLTLEA